MATAQRRLNGEPNAIKTVVGRGARFGGGSRCEEDATF